MSIYKRILRKIKYIAKIFLIILPQRSMFFLKCKFKKYYRYFVKPNYENKVNLVTFCVKRTAYCDMIINNINSLHYFNPNHELTILCDKLCYKYLTEKKSKFNYSGKVKIVDNVYESDVPWQYSKVETLIYASSHDAVMVDADSMWHSDLIIDKDKVMFLVSAYKFKNAVREEEKELIKHFGFDLNWNHYVCAFLYLPKKFLTEKLINDLRTYNDKIFNYYKLDGNENKSQIRRLSEELGNNFAIQSNVPAEFITTLKKNDPFGDKNSLQSLFYGCLNQVIE